MWTGHDFKVHNRFSWSTWLKISSFKNIHFNFSWDTQWLSSPFLDIREWTNHCTPLIPLNRFSITKYITYFIAQKTMVCNPICTYWDPSLKLLLQFSSVAQSCPTLCDPMNRSTPGLPVHHQLPEFTQTHVHRVSDAIQPSHPLSSPSPPAPNPSQHQSLFQWVNTSHEVAKVLEFQL